MSWSWTRNHAGPITRSHFQDSVPLPHSEGQADILRSSGTWAWGGFVLDPHGWVPVARGKSDKKLLLLSSIGLPLQDLRDQAPEWSWHEGVYHSHSHENKMRSGSGADPLDWAMHVDPCFAYHVFTSQTHCFLLSVAPGVPGVVAGIFYTLYLLPLGLKVVIPSPTQAPSHGSVSPWDKFSNLLWGLCFFFNFNILFIYLFGTARFWLRHAGFSLRHVNS